MGFWLLEIFHKPMSTWTWLDLAAIAVALLFLGVVIVAVFAFRDIAASDDDK